MAALPTYTRRPSLAVALAFALTCLPAARSRADEATPAQRFDGLRRTFQVSAGRHAFHVEGEVRAGMRRTGMRFAFSAAVRRVDDRDVWEVRDVLRSDAQVRTLRATLTAALTPIEGSAETVRNGTRAGFFQWTNAAEGLRITGTFEDRTDVRDAPFVTSALPGFAAHMLLLRLARGREGHYRTLLFSAEDAFRRGGAPVAGAEVHVTRDRGVLGDEDNVVLTSKTDEASLRIALDAGTRRVVSIEATPYPGASPLAFWPDLEGEETVWDAASTPDPGIVYATDGALLLDELGGEVRAHFVPFPKQVTRERALSANYVALGTFRGGALKRIARAFVGTRSGMWSCRLDAQHRWQVGFQQGMACAWIIEGVRLDPPGATPDERSGEKAFWGGTGRDILWQGVIDSETDDVTWTSVRAWQRRLKDFAVPHEPKGKEWRDWRRKDGWVYRRPALHQGFRFRGIALLHQDEAPHAIGIVPFGDAFEEEVPLEPRWRIWLPPDHEARLAASYDASLTVQPSDGGWLALLALEAPGHEGQRLAVWTVSERGSGKLTLVAPHTWGRRVARAVE